MTKTKQQKDWRAFIEKNIIGCDISYRGGTLKVDTSELFSGIEKPIMGAYQNYLGGGIAGAICGGASFVPDELSKKDQKVFFELKEAIKKYFYEVNNGGGDEYMQENITGRDAKNSYEQNQNLPAHYPGL